MPAVQLFLLRILLFLFCAGLTGCFKITPEQRFTLTEAQEKLIEICRQDYGINVVLKPLDNTLWVYLALEEPLFDIKASPLGPSKSAKSSQKQKILYLEGQFEEKKLKIQYDVSPSREYAIDYGYSSTYSEKYQTSQRNILTALTRVYNKVSGDSSEGETAPGVPEFVIIVVADIIKGIETRMIIYYPDLKRAMEDSYFQEEYVQRAVIENPAGSPAIIADQTGTHLALKEMTWPEFLQKQIIYRIHFKYERSSLPPGEDVLEEILGIIKMTFENYQFRDVISAELHDLPAGKTRLFEPDIILR